MVKGTLPEFSREWVATLPHGGLIRIPWIFGTERVLVSSPKGLADVLVTNSYQFKKPDASRRFLAPTLGFGILLAEGDVHKVQRRNLQPAFAFRHIKDLCPVFWVEAQEAALAMTNTGNSNCAFELDAMAWASRCTLDIIGLAGMGCDSGSIQDPNNELAMTYRALTQNPAQINLQSMLSFVLPLPLLMLLPLKRLRVVYNATRIIRSVCRDLICRKKEMIAKGKKRNVDNLSVALESGRFTDENLIDQLMTFLAAGHDTTATALTWAVYILSFHPEMQIRLRNKVRERLPPLEVDQAITSSDIDSMPYLNAVCNEVLRVFGPVPQTVREAVEDVVVDGQSIPKGTVVMLSPWSTNVDQALWGHDAAEFKPERWIAHGPGDKRAASGAATTNYAFLTFLHGPRSCIGASFAKSELACLLAAWVGRFEFELQDQALMGPKNLIVRHAVTARPADKLKARARIVPGW